jgi:hypothetical protein
MLLVSWKSPALGEYSHCHQDQEQIRNSWPNDIEDNVLVLKMTKASVPLHLPLHPSTVVEGIWAGIRPTFLVFELFVFKIQCCNWRTRSKEARPTLVGVWFLKISLILRCFFIPLPLSYLEEIAEAPPNVEKKGYGPRSSCLGHQLDWKGRWWMLNVV